MGAAEEEAGGLGWRLGVAKLKTALAWRALVKAQQTGEPLAPLREKWNEAQSELWAAEDALRDFLSDARS